MIYENQLLSEYIHYVHRMDFPDKPSFQDKTEQEAFSIRAAAYDRVGEYLIESFKRTHRSLYGRLTSVMAVCVMMSWLVFLTLDSFFYKTPHETISIFVFMAVTPFLCLGALHPFLHKRENDVFKILSTASYGNIDQLLLLGKIMELRGDDTVGHNMRVALYTLRLAESLNLRSDKIATATKGALLHDVGKLVIPDRIIDKPGPLTTEERTEMQKHVSCGVEIVNQMHLLRDATNIVAFHHERFDGGGYPKGLEGDQIPLEARLFALADVFDALTSVRVYKPSLTLSDALQIMRKERGSHFDACLYDHFETIAPTLYQEIPRDETGLKTMLVARLTPYLDDFLFHSPLIHHPQKHALPEGK